MLNMKDLQPTWSWLGLMLVLRFFTLANKAQKFTSQLHALCLRRLS